jgi:hypothetical protein
MASLRWWLSVLNEHTTCLPSHVGGGRNYIYGWAATAVAARPGEQHRWKVKKKFFASSVSITEGDLEREKWQWIEEGIWAPVMNQLQIWITELCTSSVHKYLTLSSLFLY